MALVLSRKVNESLIIDGDIKVTILAINRGQVRLACEAPEDVTIDREEIHIIKMESENGKGNNL